MFIQVAETPNTNALKFVASQAQISPIKPHDFPNREYAEKKSQLAENLFKIDGIERVFFGKDFVTITKKDELDWMVIKPHIFATIMEYLSNGFPIFKDEKSINLDKISESFYNIPIEDIKKDTDQELQAVLHTKYEENDPNLKIIEEIKTLIEERVRPAVEMDGGDIEFLNFVNGVVYVRLSGACVGCASSSVTLKYGIENMLKHYIPEVEEVVGV